MDDKKVPNKFDLQLSSSFYYFVQFALSIISAAYSLTKFNPLSIDQKH